MEQNKKHILVGIATNGTGGVDSYILNFVRATFSENITCDVLSTQYSEKFEQKLKAYNAKLIEIANLHDKKSIFSTINDLCNVTSNVGSDTRMYDAAYLNVSTAIMYPYAKACSDAGIKNIVMHSHAHYNSQPNFIKTALYDFAHYYYRNKLNKLDVKYAACSKDSAEWLAGPQVILNDSWVFVPNPIDVEACAFDAEVRDKKIAELSEETKADLNKKTIIGTATAFMPYKNPLFLIDVFKEYLKLDDNAFLLVAGDGPMKDDMVNKAKKLLPGGTYKLLGKRSDVAELLQVYDCFVLPSKNEGLPLCVLEAQAADLPVVMSSTITDEVIVLARQVTKVDLNKGPKIWAQKIRGSIANNKTRSAKAAQTVSEAGFNLNSPKTIIPYL